MTRDLERNIDNAYFDLVTSATPISITRVLKVKKPMQHERYELQEIGKPTLEGILKKKFGKK